MNTITPEGGCAVHAVHAVHAEQPQRRTWTVAEAAIELGISTALLRDLIREGYVPVLRLGRRVLVRRETTERLVREPEGEDARIVQIMEARRMAAQTRKTAQSRT